MDEESGRGWLLGWFVRRAERLRGTIRDEQGFTLIELLVVVVIIGVLAAIAVPVYVGQQDKAKDTAAETALRTAATAQQLHYADPNKNSTYASDEQDLVPYGFRQGDQRVDVRSGGDSYCMDAPGGSKTFHITPNSGKPEPNAC